ncbi:unnamed protein product [Allacma fusca]|uniref:Uncharacterized protein n=1 Tax=Allacma fusca TaxID=39272 RepID=A0A8J2KT18_9HEXA|nr:unnamed protein product [Allacma fusca]
MIVVKIRDTTKGTVQATFYESTKRSTMFTFTDRVYQGDVRNTISRLIGKSIAITDDVSYERLQRDYSVLVIDTGNGVPRPCGREATNDKDRWCQISEDLDEKY